MTFAEAEAAHPDVFRAMMQRDPDACPPKANPPATASRTSAPSSTSRSRTSTGRTLFVSHAFTLNLLLRRLLGLADSPSVFFRTDNCGLHRLKRAHGGFWNVEAVNDRRDLADVGR